MKKVLIYTLNYCPFCQKAIDFLKNKEIPYENIDITYDEEEMTKKIAQIFNIKDEITFPQIIIGKDNIGGYDNITELEKNGKLEELLKD